MADETSPAFQATAYTALGTQREQVKLPSEVFDRPNANLGVPPFVTREFFSQLSDRVWAVFDREIDEIAKT